MKISVVDNSWIRENKLRLDSSFHLSDGPSTIKKLKDSKYEITTLEDECTSIFKGNIFKRTYVLDSRNGFTFMTASDMMKSNIETGTYISKKYTRQHKELLLEKDWILVSRSGTLGNTVFTNKNFEGVVGSDDLIRVVPKENKIKKGFLYAYLSSKYGHGLLTQSSYGGVVKHIEPHHIKNLPIPVLPDSKQANIHNLILEASKLKVEANMYLEKAICYFEENYGVNVQKKIFKKNLTDIGFSWAAYNNNLECDEIESKIGNNKSTISSYSTKIFSPPLFKHIYLTKDNGHPFLTGSELTRSTKKAYRWLSPRGVKNIIDYKVSKGTLLFYKSGTTDGGILGNVFIADDIIDGFCLSDHIIRVFTLDLNISYWMFAFFKSSPGIKLLQKMATGTMIPFITPSRLSQVNVPVPDDSFEFVVSNVNEYLNRNTQAQLKETEAISLVEKEIESWQ